MDPTADIGGQVVTEASRARAAASDVEAKYRALVEQISAITYTWSWLDDAYFVDYVSPQIQEILGYTPDGWRADPTAWYAWVHPDDRAGPLEHGQARFTELAGDPPHRAGLLDLGRDRPPPAVDLHLRRRASAGRQAREQEGARAEASQGRGVACERGLRSHGVWSHKTSAPARGSLAGAQFTTVRLLT